MIFSHPNVIWKAQVLPNGKEGELIYAHLYHLYPFCNVFISCHDYNIDHITEISSLKAQVVYTLRRPYAIIDLILVHVFSIKEQFSHDVTADPHNLPRGFASFWKHPDPSLNIYNRSIQFWLIIIIAVYSVGLKRGELLYYPFYPYMTGDQFWIQNQIQNAICFLLIRNM